MFFLTLPYCACNFPPPLLNNEAELSLERFGLNEMIRFLLSYQFKREDMRVELALWIRPLNWGFLIEKGQSNCGKSLVSILFLTLYTEELFTWFLYRLHESLICSLAKKNCFVVGCVGKRWVLASMNSAVKYFVSYVWAQTLSIFSLMYQHTDEARSIFLFY